jgi:glutathione S-transferase
VFHRATLCYMELTCAQKVNDSVVERFQKEIKRVVGVIDAHLKKAGTPYLVGDKATYADIAWVPWFFVLGSPLIEFDYEKEHPTFAAWLKALRERSAVQKVYASPEYKSQH